MYRHKRPHLDHAKVIETQRNERDIGMSQGDVVSRIRARVIRRSGMETKMLDSTAADLDQVFNILKCLRNEASSPKSDFLGEILHSIPCHYEISSSSRGTM